MTFKAKLNELLLLRHAKSHWKGDQIEDMDRPISDKGKKAACKMSQWLFEHELIPEYVLVSPSKRTQQTLKRLNLPKTTIVQTLDDLYLADLETLKSILSTVGQQYSRVMLVGHNPGFEKLMRWLTTEVNDHTPPPLRLFPTGSLAHIILPPHWQNLNAGDGRLANFIRPKEITLNKSKEKILQ